MVPSLAFRSARLAAFAVPLLRSRSIAFSMSPPHSCRAPLQSIIPAPVRSRSAFTSFALISFVVIALSPRVLSFVVRIHKKRRRPGGATAGRRPASASGYPRFRGSRARSDLLPLFLFRRFLLLVVARLQMLGDHFRTRPTLAARTALRLVAVAAGARRALGLLL